MNIFQQISQMKQNPMAMLSKRYNIPQNVNVGDPNSIIQHLMNTGQISQDIFNQKYNQANMIMRSLH